MYVKLMPQILPLLTLMLVRACYEESTAGLFPFNYMHCSLRTLPTPSVIVSYHTHKFEQRSHSLI